MPVIVVDGPEKSGKSTFIEVLVHLLGPKTRVRHHGPPISTQGRPLDLRYSAELQADLASTAQYTIYDRCWASDHVYDSWLKRPNSRLASNAFLGEWMYGRAVATAGARVMLLGPSDAHLYARRTPDDHALQPHLERQAFQQYAETWGWDRSLRNSTDPSALEALAKDVIELAKRRTLDMMNLRLGPLVYTGWAYPRVLFVGEVSSTKASLLGAFLPFSSMESTAFAQSIGPLALKCGWVSAVAVTDELLSRARLIVTCSAGAKDRVNEFSRRGLSRPQIMDIHNPSWLYKWGEAAGLRAPTEVRVRRTVFQHLGLRDSALQEVS